VKTRCTLLIAVVIAAMSAPLYALTVDEIIAKNINAKGGMEKLQAVKSKKITGKTFVQGMEFPFIIQQKRPSLFKLETTVQGLTMSQAYDGETAWAITPNSAGVPQKLPSIQTTAFRNQADFDGPLVGYKEMGYTAELIGKEKMEGSDVYHLRLAKSNKSADTNSVSFETHLYLDAGTFLEKKITIKGKVEGNTFEVDTYPGDYKEVGGIMTAHSLETKMGGKTVSKMIMETIEWNADIADSVFSMPVKKGKPPEAKNK